MSFLCRKIDFDNSSREKHKQTGKKLRSEFIKLATPHLLSYSIFILSYLLKEEGHTNMLVLFFAEDQTIQIKLNWTRTVLRETRTTLRRSLEH
ncbi:hypothetical protein CDAR_519181 [Caerostris darwini]|uniref:Uncharacterized protein n=1 Tax=Caerostris darwini TaxID=1538125 RepID=A0AAV4PMR2_9ARAC|nr:hypothetical protein CDAR_519181 [Caerostris darwini]